MKELSKKPYFIRAIHDWCTDNGYTPYLMVFVDERSNVPLQYVNDGKIVLNIGAFATSQLAIEEEYISFQARFSGVARDIYVHIEAVMAIFAQETGDGMHFEVEPYDPATFALRVQETEEDLQKISSSHKGKDLKLIVEDSEDPEPSPPTPTKKVPHKKPTLKVVK